MLAAAVPPEQTVFEALDTRYGVLRSAAALPDHEPRLPRYKLGFDLEPLATACREVIRQSGLRGFRNTDDDTAVPAYGSLSLTFSPDNEGDPHSSTLGSSHLRQGQYFYGTPETKAQMPQVKGDYYDTYGFRRLTPAGGRAALGELLRGFRLPVLRSRLSVIQANRPEASQSNFGWHRDEPVFHNLRINIPVWTAPDYLLEIETGQNLPSDSSPTAERYHLACGQAYSWDTNRQHCVLARTLASYPRCHLVIGLAPWFDHDPVNDAWEPNRYFGKLHPHDIVAQGLAHPLIRAAGMRDAA